MEALRTVQKTASRRQNNFLETARSLLCLSDGAVHNVLNFYRHTCPESTEPEVKDIVECLTSWYTSATQEEKDTYRDPGLGTRSSSQVRLARRFLEEQSLHDWVAHKNEYLGIAPSTTLVLDQRAALREGLNTKYLGTVKNKSKKGKLQWLRRWRARWDLRLGSIAARERVPPADSKFKVVWATGYQKTRAPFGPKIGPK